MTYFVRLPSVSCPCSIKEEQDKETSFEHENYSNDKFSIRFSDVYGRYLVAEKDFESQELIIDEIPIVVAPSGQFDVDPKTSRPLPVCIGCLQGASPTTFPSFVKCSQCSWPLCSSDCIGLKKLHTPEECVLFQSRGICQSARSLRMVYLIRCCLMFQHNKENWTKLLQLASESMNNSIEQNNTEEEETKQDINKENNNELNLNLEHCISANSTITSEKSDIKNASKNDKNNHKYDINYYIRKRNRLDFNFIREVCQLDYVTEEMVAQVNGIKRVNGFGFTNCYTNNTNSNTGSGDDVDTDEIICYYGLALYFLASMASHGCSPNLTTQVDYDPSENFPMRFRTKCQVKKGQILQIAYTSRWLVLGTLRRREKIYTDFKFMCGCSRCGDRTEGNTFFSAVVCPKCRRGNLLPVDPLDTQSSWTCDGLDCLNTLEEQDISNIIERFNDDIENILESQNLSGPMKFEQLSKILMENSTRGILHKNHYLVLRAEMEWIVRFPYQRLGHISDNSEQTQDSSSFNSSSRLLAWNLFTQLIDRGEHCKLVYSQLIPDWLEDNYFVDIAIARGYLNYYLDSEFEKDFSWDLSIDLMKITVKYFQDGLRYADPFSDIATLVKSSCRSLQQRIDHLTSLTNCKKQLIANNCEEYDLNECD